MENKILAGCEPSYLQGNQTGCLLLHGFTSSPHDMHLLGEILHKKGYTVHIPLLPGHGTSEKNLKNIKWYQWFEAAKNELFQLRKTCKKVFVIGFSMGGSLGVQDFKSKFGAEAIYYEEPHHYLILKLIEAKTS